jgi:hypothetical protein
VVANLDIESLFVTAIITGACVSTHLDNGKLNQKWAVCGGCEGDKLRALEFRDAGARAEAFFLVFLGSGKSMKVL